MNRMKLVCAGTALLCGVVFAQDLHAQFFCGNYSAKKLIRDNFTPKKDAFGQVRKEHNPYERDWKKIEKLTKDKMKTTDTDKKNRIQKQIDAEQDKLTVKLDKNIAKIQKRLDNIDKELESDVIKEKEKKEIMQERNHWRRELVKHQAWGKNEEPDLSEFDELEENADDSKSNSKSDSKSDEKDEK